ncbi:histone-lysine N-methyltransferase NSD2-like isoform X2 [Prorops nasuta]|uniref:histone-lysine N-methyltransferase NSD2-like isoform X2 n=1 Tax=Prorops nasuta TaxID=863751 RepID=UPI0034CFA3B1
MSRSEVSDIKIKDYENCKERMNVNTCNGSSPNKSHCGRNFKAKVSKNKHSGSSKNSKMPKTQEHQNSTDSNNDSIREDNLENNIGDISSDSNNEDVKEVSLNSSNSTIECPWTLGQLAWARVGNSPFWPCVVTLDPVTMVYTYKRKGKGRNSFMMIHVQYFGDRGRHGWVSANAMISFTSLADFRKLSQSLTVEIKKKDPKYAAAFIVKPGIKFKWDSAVSEAMAVQKMTDKERIESFKPKVTTIERQKKITSFIDEKSEKRKYSSDMDENAAKRIKQESSSAEKSYDKVQTPKIPKSAKTTPNGKEEVKLIAETPPSSPSSSIIESTIRPKASFKNNNDDNGSGGIFEVYYERNRDMVEEEYPDASEDDIKKYMKKTWENMNLAFRKKYRVYATSETLSKESSSDNEEELEDDKEIVKESKKVKAKTEKEVVFQIETKRIRPYNIFKGIKPEKVCQICEKPGKLTRCKGPCYSYFHLSCVKPEESSPEHSLDESSIDEKIENVKRIKRHISLDESNGSDNQLEEKKEVDDGNFKCIDCLSGVAPACFICNEREGDRTRCSALACGRHYHPACLKSWPQVQWQGGRLTCPYHMCHICISDNPRDRTHSRITNEKLARCVRCPSAYHTSSSCLPAGSQILTGSQIICPKHYKSTHPPLNAAWCFLCSRGGSLICCDTCPTSFHIECLGIDAPDGAFICEDCETGRLPLYGEIVWVKFGNYRWWPSRICYPYEIPEKVESLDHCAGNFCVMFLGSHNYYWVHRGRAFLYQDGDANLETTVNNKKRIRKDLFRIALEEANELHQRLKIEKAAAKDYGCKNELKPPSYVKLKINKPVGNVKPVEVESIVACDCSKEQENPCAPGTDCLNRILLVECSPEICPAGTKCNNQAFVRRQYPAMRPFHTAGRGWGLKTLEAIESGQFVIEYVGEIIDEAEYKQRLQRKKELKNENYYFLTIDNNRTIDAEPKGNLSRFMNHSCLPNCETQKWTVNGDTRIGLFALRDIDEGEELTFNYNLASDGETRKPCLCGAPNCSGFIGLKANKQQMSVPQQKKIDKAEKMKRRKKRRNNGCWNCGKSIPKESNYLICSQKTCNRKYHSTCVEVENADLKFICPWHFCIECSKRTSAHCSFCSIAFCQVHLDGNLIECGEKGGFVCKIHKNMDAPKSTEDEKDFSDNDVETDKEYSSIGSSSPAATEKSATRESSPRVSIVEVHVSSEESEGSQGEESYTENDNNDFNLWKKKTFHRLTLQMQKEEEEAKSLSNLTFSQLEAIIGGTLVN